MQELLRLHGEFHREARKYFSCVAVDDEADGVLGRDAPLVAVEELVLADLGSRRLVLHDGRGVQAPDVREGVRPAQGTDQQAVALRIVAGLLRPGFIRTRPR